MILLKKNVMLSEYEPALYRKQYRRDVSWKQSNTLQFGYTMSLLNWVLLFLNLQPSFSVMCVCVLSGYLNPFIFRAFIFIFSYHWDMISCIEFPNHLISLSTTAALFSPKKSLPSVATNTAMGLVSMCPCTSGVRPCCMLLEGPSASERGQGAAVPHCCGGSQAQPSTDCWA